MGEVEFEGPVTTRERSRCCRCLGVGGGGMRNVLDGYRKGGEKGEKDVAM